MTEAFNKITHAQYNELKDALDNINQAIQDAYAKNTDSSAIEPDSVFAQQVVDWLVEQNLIQLPREFASDEHFMEHRYVGKMRNQLVQCWGSALLQSPGDPDTYELHLFVSDFEPRDDFEELSMADFRRVFKQACAFYELAASGELMKVMHPQHQAYKVVKRIEELTKSDRLKSVRYWVLSNRVFPSSEGNQRNTQNNIEFSVQIVDLNYISGFFTNKLEINQNFESVGGLEGILIKSNREQDYDCILTSVSGNILAQLYSLHGPAIVRANVRAYLGEVTVNKAIQNTVLTEPARFLAYNNGLVVSANSVDFHDGRLWDLKGIQIINGGQTTACIYQSWLKAHNTKKDPEAGRRVEENLKKIRVPMKIVISHEDATDSERGEFRVRISEAANSQNVVRHSDLMANSPFQIDFATRVNSMRTPNGNYWFYEAARGLYTAEQNKTKGDRTRTKKFNAEHPKSQRFDKTDFALAFLACEGKAQICAKGKELAFNQFHQEISKHWDYDNGFSLSISQAQELVSRWILFSTLEKSLKDDKKLNVKNPRIAVLYTLAMLNESYSEVIHWDRIWSRQAPSELFLLVLKESATEINSIIRDNMGNFMINMFGRQARCMEVVRANFRFDHEKMRKIYELS